MLIRCPECAREISDAAPACIGCGRPLRPRSARLRRLRPAILALVAIALVGGVAAARGAARVPALAPDTPVEVARPAYELLDAPRSMTAPAEREKAKARALGECEYPGEDFVPCWCVPLVAGANNGCAGSGEFLEDVQRFGPPRFLCPSRRTRPDGVLPRVRGSLRTFSTRENGRNRLPKVVDTEGDRMYQETNQRRVCWLICVCLAWPKGHPAREVWAVSLAAELAAFWSHRAGPLN